MDLYGVDDTASVNLARLNFSSLGGSKIRKFNLSNSTTRLLQTQLLVDHFRRKIWRLINPERRLLYVWQNDRLSVYLDFVIKSWSVVDQLYIRRIFYRPRILLQQLFKINSMKFDPGSIKKVIQDASQDETESMRSVKKTMDTHLFVAQAFAANRICKIPCISTRWVRFLLSTK